LALRLPLSLPKAGISLFGRNHFFAPAMHEVEAAARRRGQGRVARPKAVYP